MDKALPLYTINSPSGNPYISIVDDEQTIRLQLHSYDKEFKHPIFLTIDKRAVKELIQALEKVQ